MTRFLRHIMALAVAFCVTACAYENHFVDDEEGDDASAVVTVTDLNASDYGKWVYLDMGTCATVGLPVGGEWVYSEGTIAEPKAYEEPANDWHVAFHRYEMKTNGAAVCDTGTNDFDAITTLPDGDYVADETIRYEEELAKDAAGEQAYLFTTDMSNMMAGSIGYARETTLNRTLCDAITRTPTGGMPPTLYGVTGRVYVLRWTDGSWAKMQFTSAYSAGGGSGYLSFRYTFFL